MAEEKENKKFVDKVRVPPDLMAGLRKEASTYTAKGEPAPPYGQLLWQAWNIWAAVKAEMEKRTGSGWPTPSDLLQYYAKDEPPGTTQDRDRLIDSFSTSGLSPERAKKAAWLLEAFEEEPSTENRTFQNAARRVIDAREKAEAERRDSEVKDPKHRRTGAR